VVVPSYTSRAAKNYLSTARECLSVGETAKGRRMAQAALSLPACARDTHVQATALCVLSQACVLDSRFRLAYRLSSRAGRLFRRHSDADGQAESLAILSYSAATLTKCEQASRAARESVALRAHSKSALVQSLGLNYSGVAAFWARDFGSSSGVLDAAAWLVKGHSRSAVASFQPLVNRAFCEVLRVVEPERNGWSSHEYSFLTDTVSLAGATERNEATGFLNKVTADIGLLLLDFERCFLASRLGQLDEADEHYLHCLSRASRVPRSSWLHAILWWSRLERAKAKGQVGSAIASAAAMRQAAIAGEHLQLASLAARFESLLWSEIDIRDEM